MNKTFIRPAGSPLGLAGAILLISASSALGAYYGFQVGSHVHIALGFVFAGAALGGEMLKPFAVAQTFLAFRSREWLQGLACAALALVCVAYSFASELSLAAGARGDLAAQRSAAADTRDATKARRDRAASELKSLAPARSADALQPLIDALKKTKGADGCIQRPQVSAAREACAKAAALESEAANFKRRAELEAAIAKADAELSRPDTQQTGAADPLAAVLAAYAAAAGHDVDADAVAPWLALIPVLFLELGSALSIVVLRGVSAPAPAQQLPAGGVGASAGRAREPDPLPMLPAEQTPASDQTEGAGETNVQPIRPARKPRGIEEQKIANAVLAFLAECGGKTFAGQRAIARAVGYSKSRVNEVLNDLAAAGEIAMRPTPQGTALALA
jgi:hypothetical protein